MKGSLLRFLAGLVLIDAAVVLGASVVLGRGAGGDEAEPETQVTAPASSADAETAVPWDDVDPVELARRVAAVYGSVQRHVGKNARILLAGPREAGHDLEIRVSLARLANSKKPQGYPVRSYCFSCEAQRCRFDASTRTALLAIAGAFASPELEGLAGVAGTTRVQLTYVGSASAGPLRPFKDEKICDGDTVVERPREETSLDTYLAEECGAHECLAGRAARTIGTGRIADNETLACLRAFCLERAAPASGAVPVAFVGEVAFAEGPAYRTAEVVLTLRGLAHPRNREFADRFHAALADALRAEGQP